MKKRDEDRGYTRRHTKSPLTHVQSIIEEYKLGFYRITEVSISKQARLRDARKKEIVACTIVLTCERRPFFRIRANPRDERLRNSTRMYICIYVYLYIHTYIYVHTSYTNPTEK